MRILQEGAIRKLHKSTYDSNFHPLLQILETEPLHSGYFAVVLSDGVESLKCLSEDLFAKKLESGEIRVLTIGTVNVYNKAIVKGVECVVIKDFAMLVTPVSREGNPRDIESGESKLTSNLMADLEHHERMLEDLPKADTFTPIRALNTFSTDWTLKARVTKKWEMKEWNNSRGNGKLFTANLMDSLGDEIAATFFNQGADKFYEMMTEKGVFTFSKGQVKLANRKFTTVQCEYQLSFDKNSEIAEVPDDGSINSQRFHLVSLDQLGQIAKKNGALVDICAVVKEVGELTEFISKRGDPLKKRTLVLADPSLHTVELTLWNEDALNQAFDNAGTIVLLGKSLKVSEFNNVSLGIDRNVTKLIFNPEGIQEAEAILKWRDHFYDPGNPTTHLSVRCTFPRQREFRTLRSVNEEWQTCTNPAATDVFLVRTHINFIKHDDTTMWYSSCFNAERCKKKVVKEGEVYRCDACAETAEFCVYRYVVSMKICDETDGIWVSAFDEKFTEIIGITANDLKRIQDESEEDYKEKVAACLNQRLEFVIRASMQEGGQGLRPKFAIQAVNPVDHHRLIKTLLSDLAVMMSLQASMDY